MRKIKNYVTFFVSVYLFQFFLSIILYIFLQYNNTIFEYFNKNNRGSIVVFGNSHTECAVNDKIIPNRFKNLSTSGEPLFYTSLKVQKIITLSSIDTVVIEYGNFTFNSLNYVIGDEHFLSNFHKYFSLMNYNDFLFLFTKNPIKFTKAILSINIITILRNQKIDGKHLPLNRFISFDNKSFGTTEKNMYKADWVNFNKLFNLIKVNRNVFFILIRCPVHITDQTGFNVEYNRGTLFLKSLPNVILFDFKNSIISDSSYADDEHLNSIGARNFTNLLNDKIKLIKK